VDGTGSGLCPEEGFSNTDVLNSDSAATVSSSS
jgi:hypothetical protein